jgi:hypothetical protein
MYRGGESGEEMFRLRDSIDMDRFLFVFGTGGTDCVPSLRGAESDVAI